MQAGHSCNLTRIR